LGYANGVRRDKNFKAEQQISSSEEHEVGIPQGLISVALLSLLNVAP